MKAVVTISGVIIIVGEFDGDGDKVGVEYEVGIRVGV
jgi:hypothetical protein